MTTVDDSDASHTALAMVLPTTVAELQSLRISPPKRSLYDDVERAIFGLIEDPHFRRLLEATRNKDAVEGSLVADDYAAAGCIRDYALQHDLSLLTTATLQAIVHALRSSMPRRFRNFGRKDRAQAANNNAGVSGLQDAAE
jgi:hypothetical protein